MKKILALVLALMMCVSVFATISVSADEAQGGATEEIEYILKENFNQLSEPLPAIEWLGFKPMNSFVGTDSVKNGVYSARLPIEGETVQGMFDFQMWTAPQKAMAETFTLSMQTKFTGVWLTDSVANFIAFRNYKHGGNTSSWYNLFKIVGGKFTMVTDNGDVSSDADIFNSFATIDYAFTKTGDVFTSLDCYVNGVLLGTKTFVDAKLTGIDQFRMFWMVVKGQGVALDSFAFVKGARTLYGVEVPDNGAILPPEPVPSAPTVTDDQKSDVTYYYHENFNDITEVNTSFNAGDVRAAGGFALQVDGATGKYAITEEGTLKWTGATFFDFQFYQLNKYSVKQDHVFSVKFKPTAENISGHFLSQIRRDSSGTWTEYGTIQFSKGCIVIGGDNYGILPVNEWTLLEVVFNYNDELKEFDSYTLLINGNEMVTKTLSSDLALTQIKQFRMFRSMGSNIFELDDLCVFSGDKSVLYANAYVDPDENPGENPEENPGENTEENPGENTDENTDVTPGGDANTEANNGSANTNPPTTSKPSTGTEPVEDKKGCSSSVSLGAIALVSVIGVAGISFARKKED